MPANEDQDEPSLRFGKVKQPRMPEFEALVQGVYQEDPFAKGRRDVLLRILDTDPFDQEFFLKTVNGWNANTEKEKGYEGQPLRIEQVNGKHGRLNVYHFDGSRSVKFGFDLKQ